MVCDKVPYGTISKFIQDLTYEREATTSNHEKLRCYNSPLSKGAEELEKDRDDIEAEFRYDSSDKIRRGTNSSR